MVDFPEYDAEMSPPDPHDDPSPVQFSFSGGSISLLRAVHLYLRSRLVSGQACGIYNVLLGGDGVSVFAEFSSFEDPHILDGQTIHVHGTMLSCRMVPPCIMYGLGHPVVVPFSQV